MKNWLKKAAPIVLGLVAIIGLGVGIYQVLHKSRPYLTVEIVADSNVVDINQPQPDLNIVFQGENIAESNLNLRIHTIRIINNGDANLLQGDYDQQLPLGLRILGARIVQARMVQASNDYLATNAQPVIADATTIYLNKVILEPKAWFSIEVLFLHSREADPAITALGKVAGLDSIPVTYSLPETESRLISKIFAGTALVQLLRGLSYGIAFLVGIGSIAGIGDLVAKVARARRAKKFDAVSTRAPNAPLEWVQILRLGYRLNGTAAYSELRRLFGNEKALEIVIRVPSAYPFHHQGGLEREGMLWYMGTLVDRLSALDKSVLVQDEQTSKVIVSEEFISLLSFFEKNLAESSSPSHSPH